MNNKDFDKLLNKRIESMKAVLSKKGKEYSSEFDKLHNFKRAGQIQDMIPEKALIGMWTKHLVSILDIIDNIILDDFFDRKTKLTKKILDEKIGDLINYLPLLEALIKERYGWQ